MPFHRSRLAATLAFASLFLGLQIACRSTRPTVPTSPVALTKASVPALKYCTYKVINVMSVPGVPPGYCDKIFKKDSVICPNCPGETCPGPLAKRIPFDYVEGSTVKCKGELENLSRDCTHCPGLETNLEFVNQS
jgi:hypothetical protein